MRLWGLFLAGLTVAHAGAQAPPPKEEGAPVAGAIAKEEGAPDPQVAGLNNAIRTRLEAIDAHNAQVRVAEAQYAKDRAAFEAAVRLHDEQTAAADARRKAWEAETANWSKAVAAAKAPPSSRKGGTTRNATLASGPAGTASDIVVDGRKPARICHYELETGSLVKRHRVCMTASESEGRTQVARDELRRLTSGVSSCGKPICE
ncbi:hypothetical protein [Sphingomonas sp.]|uniref:hypothetical protein n=1 Tax=Sphingomonas sp. TaxID=28214 RepID=UPI000DB2BB3B|nr:hypothetical protein [Sphingomonas sp.]PZU07432.1 MAG: hypothetical protein DI605_15285 [Sphingomonas sp.]